MLKVWTGKEETMNAVFADFAFPLFGHSSLSVFFKISKKF